MQCSIKAYRTCSCFRRAFEFGARFWFVVYHPFEELEVPATGRVTGRVTVRSELRGMFAVLLGFTTHATPSASRHATAASAVSIHDGMSLNALAAAVKRADIRICLTVTEHFGYTQP